VIGHRLTIPTVVAACKKTVESIQKLSRQKSGRRKNWQCRLAKTGTKIPSLPTVAPASPTFAAGIAS
jgi:hypothetical protein